MYLSEQAVSPAFRTACAMLLPGLGVNKAYWRLAGYLMFGGGMEGGELLIPAPLLAMMEGKKVTGKYNAWQFLEAFQRDVVRITIKAHTIETCRTVSRVHWPEPIRMLLAEERRTLNRECVLFSSGVKWRNEHARKEREALQAEAIETLQNMGHHPAYNLLNLLNHAVPNRFAAVKKYLTEAHTLVDSLNLLAAERERQHNILKAIEKQAVPIYGPSPRSVRIFAMNDSITRLQRDVRKVLTREWINADLKSAQMAIVARVWDVPEVTAFLRSGGSIWQELCDWMGLSLDYKPLLKDALYALIFGAGRDKMREIFLDCPGINCFRRFRSHKLIHALFLARARQLRTIRNDKGGVDAYGTKIQIEYISLPGKRFTYDSSRKILALIAQSFELRLLSPVIDLALQNKDSARGFVLCTWLHDGCTFDTYDNRDRDSWCNRLKKAVKKQCESLSIETELEFELGNIKS